MTATERAEFEAHLAMCAACAAEVRRFGETARALAQAAPHADPSPVVRARLLSMVAASREAHDAPVPRRNGPSFAPWLAAAASIVLAVALGGYAAHLRGRVATLEAEVRLANARAAAGEGQLAAAQRTAGEARAMVAVLAAPDVARVDLAGQPAAPLASARAFWSRSRGLVIAATNLPPLPTGRTYQVWVLTAQTPPISAGLLKPDANGRATGTFDTPPDLPTPTAMAVTNEPEGGVPAPTGDKYLVGVAH